MPIDKRLFRQQRRNRRVLALHVAMVDKLIQQPELLGPIEARLEARYAAKLMRYGSYIVWKSLLPLLRSDPALFKKEVLADEDKMEQLRQETIFVGVLTEDERKAVLDNFSDVIKPINSASL